MFMKKASLNLSVNAIVVLILAITMLGLGLGFMKSTFGGVTEQFEQVSGDLEKQLVEELGSKGLPASFSVYSMDTGKSETKNLFFAVKATVAGDCEIIWETTGGAGSASCTSMNGLAGACGTNPPKLRGFSSTGTLQVGDTKVMPIKLETAGTTVDTYVLAVTVTGCHANPGATAELIVEVS